MASGKFPGPPWKEDWEARQRAAERQRDECAAMEAQIASGLAADPADASAPAVEMKEKAAEARASFAAAARQAAWLAERTQKRPAPPTLVTCGRCPTQHERGSNMKEHVCARHVRSSLPQVHDRDALRAGQQLVSRAVDLRRAVRAGDVEAVRAEVKACLADGSGEVGHPADAQAVAAHYGAAGGESVQSAAARLEGALRAFAAVCAYDGDAECCKTRTFPDGLRAGCEVVCALVDGRGPESDLENSRNFRDGTELGRLLEHGLKTPPASVPVLWTAVALVAIVVLGPVPGAPGIVYSAFQVLRKNEASLAEFVGKHWADPLLCLRGCGESSVRVAYRRVLRALRDAAPDVPVRREPQIEAAPAADGSERVVRPRVARRDDSPLTDLVAVTGAGGPDLPPAPGLPVLPLSRSARKRRRLRARWRGMIAEAQLRGVMDACRPETEWPEPRTGHAMVIDGAKLWQVCDAGLDAGLTACHEGAVTDSSRTGRDGRAAPVKLPFLDHAFAHRGLYLALRVILASYGIKSAFYEYRTVQTGRLRNIDLVLGDDRGLLWFGDMVLHDLELTPVFTSSKELAPGHECEGCGLCRKRKLCRQRQGELVDIASTHGFDLDHAGFVVFHVWPAADAVIVDRLPSAFLATPFGAGFEGLVFL